MTKLLDNYIDILNQAKRQDRFPKYGWILAFRDIWKDPNARREWIEYYYWHQHDRCRAQDYIELLHNEKIAFQAPISDREKAIGILAHNDLHNLLLLHKTFDIKLASSTVLRALSPHATLYAMHVLPTLPLQSLSEERDFCTLLQRMEYSNFKAGKSDWTALCWYVFHHHNQDLRVTLITQLADKIESTKRFPPKILPREQTGDPSNPYVYWTSSVTSIPKIIEAYLPDLYHAYAWYKESEQCSAKDALVLAWKDKAKFYCESSKCSGCTGVSL